MRESLLNWRDYRYLKASLLVLLASVAVYASQHFGQLTQPPNGGTWQGYVLGTAGALLIVWLSLLGLRKRRYRSNLGTVQGWASAHVYLGTMLLVIATLHCALQFGFNVHTLAYVLMCLVIFSGFYGLYAYLHLPGRVVALEAGVAQEDRMEELARVDVRIREASSRCDANLQSLVISALDLTRVGGSAWQQLMARDRSRVTVPGGREQQARTVSNSGQAVVIEHLSSRIPDARKQSEAEVLNELLALFGRRQVLLQQLRREVQLRGLLKIWLYFHIPLTMALLVALLVHILSVFIYW
ncbi:MAG: hypothetical protein CME40_05760 [Haliea sp.]|jgi:hypothetical protein|nr:hypothetical protein [Haliea sp.]MAL94563.1 hypothetical protein [Haliea sp.]|tara:strand:- start:703 stop:1596 length:894 start_codon:yes stop_codon:yes gene_type:complete